MYRVRDVTRTVGTATVMALAFFATSPSFAAKPAPVNAPVGDRNYPAPGSKLARDLQNALFAKKCYGNQLTATEVDGKFGDRSKRALIVFVRQFNDQFFANTAGINFTSAATLLETLRSPTLPENFCIGSPHFAEWFPDQNEHIPGADGIVITKRAPKDPPTGFKGYPAPYSPLAKELQAALYAHKCYGNQLDEEHEIDQMFEDKSRRALWVFMDTFNERTAKSSTLRIGSAENALTILKSSTLPSSYCANSRFRAEWFPSNNEHIDENAFAAGPQIIGGSCNRDSVGRNYLSSQSKLAPELSRATSLRDPLKFFVDNFDAIFPPAAVDITARWDDEQRKRLEESGKPRVTQTSAKAALQEAARQLTQLSFSYGISQQRDCEVCYKINDWIYLRNLAQANGGYLVVIRSVPQGPTADGRPKGNQTAFYRYEVDLITEEMLRIIGPQIKIHRSVTANLNQHLQYLSVNKLPDGMDRQKIALKIPELSLVRDASLAEIIDSLMQASPAAKRNDQVGNRLLKALAGKFECTGFDGNTLDQ